MNPKYYIRPRGKSFPIALHQLDKHTTNPINITTSSNDSIADMVSTSADQEHSLENTTTTSTTSTLKSRFSFGRVRSSASKAGSKYIKMNDETLGGNVRMEFDPSTGFSYPVEIKSSASCGCPVTPCDCQSKKERKQRVQASEAYKTGLGICSKR